MASQDNKFTFSIDGVKYKDINGNIDPRNPNLINLRVSGTAQMVRQYIKQKYPNIPSSDYVWVKSRSFANGNSIDIYLNNAPDDVANKINSELEQNFEYGSYHFQQKSSSKVKNETDEGKEINYGTKYISVQNFPPSDISAPIVDWSILTKAPKKVLKTSNPKSSSGSGKTFDKGELITSCGGWDINKKVYADGRILYTANKNPNTPKNKTDWNIIKGEILTETGFAYGRFGNFQKFGTLTSESVVIAKLCEILSKYYVNTPPTQPTNTINTKTQNPKLREIADNLITTDKELLLQIGTNDVFAEQNLYSQNWADILLEIPMSSKNKMNISEIWKSELRFDLSKLTEKELIAVGVILKEQNANIINNVLGLLGLYGQKGIDLYKERYEKSPSVYLYPMWFETLRKNAPTQAPTPSTVTVPDPIEEAKDIAEQFMNVDYNISNKLNIISGTQLYNSQMLQEDYAKLFKEAYNNIIYYYPTIRIEVKSFIHNKLENDNYHVLNNALALIGFYGDVTATISVNDYTINPSAYLNPIYYDYNPFGGKQTAVVAPPSTNTTGLNESYKLLPPNPKLEFCAITMAEGSYPDGTFPIRFQSFTALTKFIADNIKNMPKKGEGYDKYFLTYKWNFGNNVQVETTRYDIGESDANPFKYSNLWAFYKLRNLCYDAWFKNGFSFGVYETDDWYCSDGIGKDGWELNSVEFMSLLSDMIEYYPKDIKKFDYNTKDERLDRFKAVYPKLFQLFSEQSSAVTRESIESIIRMYEIKAKRGDTSVQSIIKMYQIKLKRL